MTVYEKNIVAIKSVYPYLYTALEELSGGGENYSIEINDSGEEYLLYRGNSGQMIQYTSMMNIEEESEEYAKSIDLTYNKTAVIQVGIRLGRVAKKILETINERSILFVCEPDLSLLKDVLERVDFSSDIEDGRIVLIAGGIPSQTIESQIQDITMYGFNSVIAKRQSIVFPFYTTHYIKFARQVLKSFQEALSYTEFAIGNNVDDTLVGLENHLWNINALLKQPGINEFRPIADQFYRGKPAIVVASGPSLDKNIHLFKDVADRALILSCDGSVQSLRKNGVTPDAMGSIERILYTYEAFYRHYTLPEKTMLVSPIIVPKEVVNTFDRSILFMGRGMPIPAWVNEATDNVKGEIVASPSVAHMLFSFAAELGCDPIILVGQDLAYSETGYSHTSSAETVMQTVNDDEPEESREYVEGINGERLRSTYLWKQFLKAYEQMIPSVSARVIDATEGGAKIAGTEIMSFQDVIDEILAHQKPLPQLYDLYNQIKRPEDPYRGPKRKFIGEMEERLEALNSFLDRVKRALKMIKRSQKIIDKGIPSQKKLDYIYDTIDYAGKELIVDMREDMFVGLLCNYYLKLAIYKINYVKGDVFTRETIEQNIQILSELYSVIEYYTEKMIRVMLDHYYRIHGEFCEEFPDQSFEIVDYGELYARLRDKKYDIPEDVRLGGGYRDLTEEFASGKRG